MLKEAIEKILSLAEIQKIECVGSDAVKRCYTSDTLIPVRDPLKENVEVSTLTGFMDLLDNHINNFDRIKCFVKVNDHQHVSMGTLDCDIWGSRQSHVVAKVAQTEKFQFGNFLGQEQFIIGLQAMFVDTEDRETLLKLVSSMTTEGVAISEDDGISQKATTRAGISLKKDETVKRVVKLAPYRTFREIDQPISAFVFRVRGGHDEQPTCALFEADGGKWRIDAVQSIKAWIAARNPGMPVIA